MTLSEIAIHSQGLTSVSPFSFLNVAQAARLCLLPQNSQANRLCYE